MRPLFPSGTLYLAGYAVDHALPQGLILDPTTGIISGTPTETSPPTYYTIIGEDVGFNREYGLTLAVTDPAATNPVVSSADFNCVHSGAFVGTFAADSADQSYGLVQIVFLPDGTTNAALRDLSTQSDTESGGLTGLDASMDGAGTPQAFKALRIGGSSDSPFRYSGAYRLVPPTYNYPSGFAMVDADNANNLVGIAYGSTDGAVYGDTSTDETGGLLLNINMQSPITGAVSAGIVTAMLDGQQFSGELVGNTLQFGDIYDAPYFLTQGCRLN